MRALSIALIPLILAGCGWFGSDSGNGESDIPLPYKTDFARGEDSRDFTVSARAFDATVEDVRESVRFAATRYCLSVFGGSAARWELDPVSGDWAFVRDGDDMVFTGRCLAR